MKLEIELMFDPIHHNRSLRNALHQSIMIYHSILDWRSFYQRKAIQLISWIVTVMYLVPHLNFPSLSMKCHHRMSMMI